MNATKKILHIALALFISTTFCFSVGAMQKKDGFRPNEKMFTPSDLEKNELESFSVSLKSETDFNINGPAAQIFNKAFKNQLLKDFEENYNIDLKNNVDDNEIALVKKENLKNKFKINLDLKKKNKNTKTTKVKFQKYINDLIKNKQKLKRISNLTKRDLNKNFEKCRQQLKKDLETMKKFYKKRVELFNSAVSNKKREFMEDYRKFANLAANSYEIYNKDKIKDKRKLYKIAEELKKEAKTLNLKGKLFEMYKKKILGQKPNEVENFANEFKKALNNVKKNDVLKCCDALAKENLKIMRY